MASAVTIWSRESNTSDARRFASALMRRPVWRASAKPQPAFGLGAVGNLEQLLIRLFGRQRTLRVLRPRDNGAA